MWPLLFFSFEIRVGYKTGMYQFAMPGAGESYLHSSFMVMIMVEVEIDLKFNPAHGGFVLRSRFQVPSHVDISITTRITYFKCKKNGLTVLPHLSFIFS